MNSRIRKQAWLWSLLVNLLLFTAAGLFFVQDKPPQQKQEQLLDVTLDAAIMQADNSAANATEDGLLTPEPEAVQNGEDAGAAGSDNIARQKDSVAAEKSSGNGAKANEQPKAAIGNSAADNPGRVATAPRILASSAPEYPVAARRSGRQGKVLLSVKLTASGAVSDIAVKQSSGWPELDQAAEECLKNWRFSPALNSSGQPVSCRTTIPISFRLK